MAGNFEGGVKASITNKQRYGRDFYRKIGALGGKKSTKGGFAVSHELAVAAGRLGGSRGKRGPA